MRILMIEPTVMEEEAMPFSSIHGWPSSSYFHRLTGLDVSTLPPPEAMNLATINIEGSNGVMEASSFGNKEASLHEAFEGFDNAFGAEINASDFIAMKNA